MKCLLSKNIEKMSVSAQAFLLSGMIAGCVFAIILLLGNGFFSMLFDYAAEEIPFNVFMNRCIKEGDILWNWGIDLGANFLEAFGFYNLGSPFFWLTLPFKPEQVPYVMPWIFVLKFAVAGATSALYFSRHLTKKWVILSASVLYAFSGFQLCSMLFYHFQDAVAFFPLLPYSMERLVEEKKKGWFAGACCLNILTNYVFFFQEALFLIIYYVLKYVVPVLFTKDNCFKKKQVFNSFCSCLIEGVIGVLISGILLFPVIEGIIQNPRIGNHLPVTSWFRITKGDLLRFVKAVFLPAEPMNSTYSITHSDWYTSAAYLPMVGFAFVLAYLRKNQGWLKNLLIIFLIMAIVPVLSHSFAFLNVEDYKRWYYIMTLYFVLATGFVLECPEKYDMVCATGICLGIISVFVGLTVYGNLIYSYKGYWCGIAFSVVGMLYTVWIVGKSSKEKYLLCSLVIFSMLLLGTAIHGYQIKIDNTKIDFKNFNHSVSQSVITYLESFSHLKNKIPYRYYFDEGMGYTYYNLGMMNSVPCINSFISTVDCSVREFYNGLKVGRHNMTKVGPVGTNELLGARYVISSKEQSKYIQTGSFENGNGQILYMYDNPNALPIGVSYDSFAPKSDFEKLSKNKRSLGMLQSLVVEDKDVQTAKKVLHYATFNQKKLTEDRLAELCALRNREAVKEFKVTENVFDGKLKVDKNKYVFFSVPYSRFWNARVNDKVVRILKINGLMAVPVFKGDNIIKFHYDYLPVKWGGSASVLGIVLFLAYLRLYKYD